MCDKEGNARKTNPAPVRGDKALANRNQSSYICCKFSLRSGNPAFPLSYETPGEVALAGRFFIALLVRQASVDLLR